jgi:tetratricopeptide (TPR) repeat protein
VPSRPRPRSLLPILAAAGGGLLLVAALAASLYRVPPGSIGLAPQSLAGPGWHLKAPFTSIAVVPLTGHLWAVDVTRPTPEGALLLIRLDLGYTLRPAALGNRTSLLYQSGLEGLVRDLTASTLQEVPTAALLPPDPALSVASAAGGTASLPRAFQESIARVLREAGIDTQDLGARIGASASFRPRDEVLRAALRRETEAGRGAMPAAEPTGVRLLFIGLDGADWDTIDPLLRKGRLPNLARLIGNGVRAPLRSYDPMISPLLWTTMVTGVGPDRHGVADFQAIDPVSGRHVPITSRFRKVPAIWNMMSNADLASAFVGWWASFPAEKVDGVQVSNLVPHEAMRPKPEGAPVPEGLTYPPGYFTEIRPRLHPVTDLTYEEARRVLNITRAEFEAARQEVLHPPETKDDNQNKRMMQQPVALALSILTGSDNYATIAADLAARHLPLTAVYFEGIDMMGHRFQHCMPPRMAICPPEDFARFHDAVTSFYVYQDELIGRILQAAGDGVTVLVTSDHGFKTGVGRPPDMLPYTTQQPVEWHDEEGIFILSGPASRHAVRLVSRPTLFDIAPTLLYLTGLPVAADMPGRVLIEAIDPALASAHAVRTIPTYEGLGAPREVVAASGPAAQQAQEELLANLRALGYIGGDEGGGSPGGSPSPDAAEGGNAVRPAGDAGGATPGGAPGTAVAEGGAGSAKGAGTLVFYHRNLATYFMKRRDYAQAAEQLRLANQRQKLPKTYQMLSEAYLAMGHADQAVTILHEGMKAIELMDPETVLWLVQIHLSGPGGVEAARREVREFAARTAKKPGLDDTIAGLLQERAGDKGAAIASYRRSLAADPTRVVAAQRLYGLLQPRGETATLEPILRRALARDARIDEYHNMLGAILADSGRSREAIDSFARAAQLDPDNPRFAANLGAGLARAGRFAEAAEAFERAAALAPAPPTYMKLGSVYRALRQPDRALLAFERARALGEAGSGPTLGIALSRLEMHQAGEALQVVREGLDHYPQDKALRSLYEDLLKKTRTPGSAPDRSGSGR